MAETTDEDKGEQGVSMARTFHPRPSVETIKRAIRNCPGENFMHHMQREKYKPMPLVRLRKFRDDLSALIRELEAGPHREIDIAAEHTGNPHMTHEVLEVDGSKESGKWRQLEKIYCSVNRCSRCPHGPHWYRYRTSRRHRKPAVIFEGTPVFDYEMLRELRKSIRSGTAYEIRVLPEENSHK